MTYPSAIPTGGDQFTVILDEELIDTVTSSGGPLGAGRKLRIIDHEYNINTKLTINCNVVLCST